IVAVAFRGDNNAIAFALANKTVRVGNVSDGNEIKKVDNLPSPITALAIRGDGAWFAVADEGKMIRVYNVGDGKEVKSFAGPGGRVNALAFAPNDGNLLFTAADDKTAALWNVN